MTDNRLSGAEPDKKGGALSEKRMGRPYALEPTPEVMRVVRQVARMFGTHDEIAAVLGVAASTFQEFLKRCPEVRDELDAGRAEGNLNAKRKLIKLADTNAAAAIFLCKNAGMTDRIETANVGNITIVVDAGDAQM